MTTPAHASPTSPAAMRNLVLLPFGLLACSTSILFIKESQLHPALLAALRLLVAASVLMPLFIRDLQRHWDDYGRTEFLRSSLAGLVLALHFVSWNYGARMTPAVNSTLLVNMVPLAWSLARPWSSRRSLPHPRRPLPRRRRSMCVSS